jgi:hypothetical protein
VQADMKLNAVRPSAPCRAPLLLLTLAASATLGLACAAGGTTGDGTGGRGAGSGGSGAGTGGAAGKAGSGGSAGSGGTQGPIATGGTGGAGGSGAGTGGAGGSGASTGGSGGPTGGGGSGTGGGGTGGSAGAGSGGAGGSSGGSGGGSGDGRPAEVASDSSPADSGAPDLPALPACRLPSIDHLEIWKAHGGSLRPAAGGSILTQDGGRTIAKVDFVPGGEWHEIVVPIMNSLAKQVNLTASKGFNLRYSATAELHVQLRPLSFSHGGEQWTARLPATGGVVKDLFVSFEPKNWGDLLGPPPFPFSQALRDANFFDFVGQPGTANTFIVHSLRFDGHVPPCTP